MPAMMVGRARDLRGIRSEFDRLRREISRRWSAKSRQMMSYVSQPPTLITNSQHSPSPPIVPQMSKNQWGEFWTPEQNPKNIRNFAVCQSAIRNFPLPFDNHCPPRVQLPVFHPEHPTI